MNTEKRKELDHQIMDLKSQLQKLREEDNIEIQNRIQKTMVGKYYKNEDGIYKVIGVPKIEYTMIDQLFDEHAIPAICIYPKAHITEMLDPDGKLPYPNIRGNTLIDATEEEFMKAFNIFCKKLLEYKDDTTHKIAGQNHRIFK